MTQQPGVERMPRPEEVSGVLREILAGPDFVTFGEAARWRLLSWLGERLEEMWRWMRQLLGEQTGAMEFATFAIALGAAAVLARLTARHAPEWLRRGTETHEEGSPNPPGTAAEWMTLASERAGRGELRPAATALYQGFLLTLEKRGALSFHASKTPGDYVTEIARADGAVAATGGRFLDSYQDLSFARRAPTTEGFAGLARLARDAGCLAEVSPDGLRSTTEASGREAGAP